MDTQKIQHSRRQFMARTTAAAAGLVAAGTFGFPRNAFAMPSESDLKIAEVKTYALGRRGFWVRITTDSGISGWGETDAGRPKLFESFIQDYMAKDVIGRDPFQSNPIADDLFYGNHDFGPGGTLANAIAGVDIALWDLKARILGVPLYRLLGGKYRDHMNVYGSYGTNRWQSMTPKEAADKAIRLTDLGFKTVKCRMQVRESHLNPVEDRTLEYMRTIHKRLRGRAELFTDINNGYTAKRAIQIGRVLQDELGFRFFEEPCSDQNHSETKQVVDALDLAIIAGEKEYTLWQLEELIKYADPDYLNPDVIKAAGVTTMKKIGALSQVNQKPIIMHNTRPVISTAASVHLGASYPIIGPFMEYMDVSEEKYAREVALCDRYIDYEDGRIAVPETPGLGIEINEAKVINLASSVRVSNAASFD